MKLKVTLTTIFFAISCTFAISQVHKQINTQSIFIKDSATMGGVSVKAFTNDTSHLAGSRDKVMTEYAFMYRLNNAMANVSSGSAGWGFNGNSGGGGNFIGTIDPTDLVFKTMEEEAMRIRAAGQIINIGINDDYVTEPFGYSKLQVYGNQNNIQGVSMKNRDSGSLARSGVSGVNSNDNYFLLSVNSKYFRAKGNYTGWADRVTLQSGGFGTGGIVIAPGQGPFEVNVLPSLDGNTDSLDFNKPAIWVEGNDRHGTYIRSSVTGTVGINNKTNIAQLHISADTLSALAAPNYKKALYISAIMPTSVSVDFPAVEFDIANTGVNKPIFIAKAAGVYKQRIGKDTTNIYNLLSLSNNLLFTGANIGVSQSSGAPGTIYAETAINAPLYTNTAATVTASTPMVDLYQTWNNASVGFTGIKLNVTNTASHALNDRLFSLNTNGNEVFAIDDQGRIRTTTGIVLSFNSGEYTFGTVAANLWRINTAGHFVTPSDNTYSIGLDAGNKPKAVKTYGLSMGYAAKTATYTATESDHTIDCTANTFTVTLPTAVGITGREYVVKNSGAGNITVGTTSSQTIDGATSYSLATQYKYVTVQSTGSNWVIIGGN